MNGYLLFVGVYGLIALELEDELGPEPAVDPAFHGAIKRQLEHLQAIHRGKAQMHEALIGQREDSALLHRLKQHIKSLETEVVLALGQVSGTPEEVKKRIQEIGRTCLKVCVSAEQDFLEAQQRFTKALSFETPDEIHRCTVVSVDMAEYTRHAIQRETQAGVADLHSLNRSIQRRLEEAINECGSDPARTFAYYSGDGALFYCLQTPETAVRFAICFQTNALKRNAATKEEPYCFRVGVASGDVSMGRVHSVSGSVLSFSAAGVTIINAARLQAACPQNGILIDTQTFQALPQEERDHFVETNAVKPKGHENRQIEAYRWQPA
ncbi:MAG: hypothetical protein ACO1TE_25085 [Prosthecobacter sp.]